MKITVVGLGKLGIPMATLYANVGHRVVGIDINKRLVDSLKDKTYTSPEPGLQKLLEKTEIKYTTDWKDVKSTKIVFIVAPSPSKEDGCFDDKYVRQALEFLSPHYKNQIVVIVSTLMPGQSEKIVRDYPQMRFVYSPEFIALGSVLHDMQNPDMILIGSKTEEDARQVLSVLDSILTEGCPVSMMSLTEAELAKLSLNAYLGIKIGYANFIGEMAARLGADPEVVLDAVGADSRVGKKFLKAGMPVQGPCLPRDQVALKSLANKRLMPSYLIDGAQATDVRRRVKVAQAALASKAPHAVVGIAYKPGSTVTDSSIGKYVVDTLHAAKLPVSIWQPEFDIKMTLREARTVVLCDVDPDIRKYVLDHCKDTNINLIDCWSWQ